MFYKIPIIEKLYETYSCLADGRIRLNDKKALVDSSNYAKTYTVTFENEIYISNDNMSYFVQTIGYPILAVLIKQGKITINESILPYFAGIDWKALNTEYKNDYVKTTQIILNSLAEKNVDVEFIKSETEKTYEQVKNLKLIYKKSKLSPANKRIESLGD